MSQGLEVRKPGVDFGKISLECCLRISHTEPYTVS